MHNYLWVHLSTPIFQWLELGATMQGLSSKLCSQILQTTDIQRVLRSSVSETRSISLDESLNVVIQGVTASSNQHMGSYLTQAASFRSESVLGKIMWELWRNELTSSWKSPAGTSFSEFSEKSTSLRWFFQNTVNASGRNSSAFLEALQHFWKT